MGTQESKPVDSSRIVDDHKQQQLQDTPALPSPRKSSLWKKTVGRVTLIPDAVTTSRVRAFATSKGKAPDDDISEFSISKSKDDSLSKSKSRSVTKLAGFEVDDIQRDLERIEAKTSSGGDPMPSARSVTNKPQPNFETSRKLSPNGLHSTVSNSSPKIMPKVRKIEVKPTSALKVLTGSMTPLRLANDENELGSPRFIMHHQVNVDLAKRTLNRSPRLMKRGSEKQRDLVEKPNVGSRKHLRRFTARSLQSAGLNEENLNALSTQTSKVGSSTTELNGPKEVENFWDLFKFEKQIGEGAMGKVVLATERLTKRKFAVKVFPKSTHLANYMHELQIMEKIYNREAPNSIMSMTERDSAFELELEIDEKIDSEHGGVEETTNFKPVNHVIGFEGAYTDDHFCYLLLEECEAGDVFEMVINDPEPASEVTFRFVAKQMIEAIVQCHQKNIVHRDIKPENFVLSTRVLGGSPLFFVQLLKQSQNRFLSQEGDESASKRTSSLASPYKKARMGSMDTLERSAQDTTNPLFSVVKLIDFGMAVQIPSQSEKEYSLDVSVKGLGVGTLYYLSPEILSCLIEERKISSKELFASDVWAFGACLYFCLTQGYHAFQPETPAEDPRIYTQVVQKAIMFREVRKPYWFSAYLWDLVRGCLSRDLDSRIKSFEAVRHSWIQGIQVYDHDYEAYMVTAITQFSQCPELLLLITYCFVTRCFKEMDFFRVSQWMKSVAIQISKDFKSSQSMNQGSWNVEDVDLFVSYESEKGKESDSEIQQERAKKLVSVPIKDMLVTLQFWEKTATGNSPRKNFSVRYVAILLVLGQILVEPDTLIDILDIIGKDFWDFKTALNGGSTISLSQIESFLNVPRKLVDFDALLETMGLNRHDSLSVRELIQDLVETLA
eukprot:TRINITY_DN35499_c0_g1_i1.p1 TRINITY_DN35499_c0_g1~~TRINITY_DN35499_c0_g1_i1.p1  ORF type:complete len:894 (+),score=194.11 TRINITY_DN35499_c0_g1_i1:75-2756(+)